METTTVGDVHAITKFKVLTADLALPQKISDQVAAKFFGPYSLFNRCVFQIICGG